MAKSFIANFLVNVGSKGLGKTKGEVDALGKSTQNLGIAHGNTERAAHKNFDTQAKGIIGTANSTKSFSKLAQTMNSGGGVVGAYATLAANIFAVSAAFNALQQAAQMKQVEAGLAAMGARTGQTLTVAAKGLKEITNGALSTEQALRSSAQVFSAGFNEKQLDRVGKAANDVSFALGRNMTDAMDRLVRGTIKLEPELLDELGLMTRLGESTAAYAASVNKSEAAVTTAEKRMAFFNAVLTEAETKFGGLSEEAGNLKNLDILAASFSDLTKEVLNFINLAALPLAKLMSNSPGALLGGALLFASTIKNQILPGVEQMSERTQKLSEKLSKTAKEQVATISELKPKTGDLKEFRAQIANGTASLGNYTEALIVSREALSDYQTQLDRHNSGDKKLGKKALANVTEEIEVLESYNEGLEKVIVTESQRQVQVQKSATLTAAANLDMMKTMEGVAEVYRSQLFLLNATTASTTRMAGAMNVARAAMFAAATGAKALGVAFLTFLPYLGLIVAGISLVISAFEAMKPESVKRMEKATKELQVVTEDAANKAKELNRVYESQGTLASKATQSITLQANALTELAAKYAEVAKESERAEKAGRNQMRGVARWWDTYAAAIVSDVNNPNMGVNRNTLEASRRGQFDRDFELSRILMGKNNEEVTQNVSNQLGTLEAMSRVAPELYEKILKLNGGIEELGKLSKVERESALAKMIKDIGAAAEGVAVMIENLTGTLKTLDAELGKFLNSATQKTAFDGVVNGSQAAEVAMRELTIAVASGKDVAKDWSDALLTMGDNLRKMMPPGLIDDINEINKAAADSARIRDIAERDRTPQQREELANAERVLSTRLETTQAIRTQIREIERQFSLAQQQDIVLQGIIKSEQTRLQIHARDFAITGEGVKTRIAGENRLKDIEIARLQVQININKAAIEQKKAWIETQLQIINAQKLLKEYNADQLTAALALRNDILATQRESLARAKNEAERKTYRDQITLSENVVELLTEQINARNSVLDTQNAIAREQATINALEQEAANLAQQRATAAEANAEAALTELGRQTELLGILRAQRTSVNNTTASLRRQRSLEEGRTENLAEQLAVIQETRRQELQAARESRDDELRRINAEKANSMARVSGEAAAERALVDHYQTRTQLAEQGLQVRNAEVNAANDLKILELVIFDARKDGLEWQKQSLDYVQKQVDAQRSLSEALLQQRNLQEDLELRRRGMILSEEGTEAREIRAAQLAYQLARDEASLKKTMIDLEFALLDAQRDLLAEQLSVRRDALADMNDDGRFDNKLDQLDRTIETLSSVNVSAIVDTLKREVDVQVENARLQLETLTLPRVRGTNEILSRMEGLNERMRARQEALAELSKTVAANDNTFTIVRPTTEINTEETRTQAMIASNNRLVESIDNWIGTIERVVNEQTNTTAAQGTPQELIAVVGRALQAQGVRVSEHPEFGGVGGMHRGRGHAEGRAVDVNIGTGNREWDNPAMKAKFDKLKRDLEAEYGDAVKILWGVAGHFDHMHIEFVKGFTRQVEAMERIAETSADTVVSQLDEIVVTGERNVQISAPATQAALDPAIVKMQEFIAVSNYVVDAFETLSSELVAGMAELGPEGEALATATTGITDFARKALDAFAMIRSGAQFHESFQAISTAAISALSTVQGVLSSLSDAKVAAIDKEIAAEQRRDGKSAESVEKIKSLEKQKDTVQRKAFEQNKKIQMATAIINTASAVTNALGTLPFPINIAMAAAMGALGAAQLAIIAGTSYQSTSTSSPSTATAPATLSIGKRGDSVDLAKHNQDPGGEIGYLRGAQGYGRGSSGFSVIGSAYGGRTPRGYGNTAFVVGEHGPEIMTPDAPMSVRPVNDNDVSQRPMPPVQFNIQTLDAKGVEEVLYGQRGNIIGMLREAANASGQPFLEDVNVAVYTKPNVSRL